MLERARQPTPPSSQPPRLPRHLLRAAVVAGVIVAGSTGCDKKDDRAAPSKTTSSTTASGSGAAIVLTVTGIETNGTTAPDDATVAAVKKALDGWVAMAVVNPLRTGEPAGDLSSLFSPPALERLSDPAVRAALVDEGLPPATKSIKPEVATVALSSVAAPEGAVAVFAARVDLKVRAVGRTSDVDVVHQGDLVLLADGDAWKIDSFAMHTSRDSRP
jgi:hypothetical protein